MLFTIQNKNTRLSHVSQKQRENLCVGQTEQLSYLTNQLTFITHLSALRTYLERKTMSSLDEVPLFVVPTSLCFITLQTPYTLSHKKAHRIYHVFLWQASQDTCPNRGFWLGGAIPPRPMRRWSSLGGRCGPSPVHMQTWGGRAAPCPPSQPSTPPATACCPSTTDTCQVCLNQHTYTSHPPFFHSIQSYVKPALSHISTAALVIH